SQAALKANAARLALWIEAHPDTDLGSIGYTLSRRRDHLSKRAVVLASTKAELVEGLQKIANDNLDSKSLSGEIASNAEKGAVWVFSGHGAQWPGMAQELLSTNQDFADVIDSLSSTFKRELGYTAREAISESDWSTVERVQALTFAIQVGLSAVWRSLGLRPGAVIGHSVGEVAAAVVAGALELNDAALFACRRAAIYQRLAGRGSMAMARLSFDEAHSKLTNNDRVVAAIAASPGGTVISGDTDVLTSIVSSWKKDHIVIRKIPTIDAAFHSPQIDPLLSDIRAAAGHLKTTVPVVPLYTTTLRDPRSSGDRGPEFWTTNSRGAVLLVSAVKAALEDEFSAFLEVSTSPIVAPSIRETLDAVERDDVAVCATLNPNKPELPSIMASLGNLFIHGCKIEWEHLHPVRDMADLPTMAWEHRPYWPATSANNAGRGFGHSPDSHTLLGQAEHIRSTPPLTVWRTQLDFSTRPYPGMHPLFGVEIVPAAALLHSLMRAGTKNDGLATLVDIGLNTPVPVDSPLDLQIVQQGSALKISTRREDTEGEHAWSWTTHTTAHVEEENQREGVVRNVGALGQRCDELWTWERVESLYQKRGIGGYGFSWRMSELRRGNDEIFASFVADGSPDDQRRTWAETLDAALTICPLLLPDDELLRMPSRIGRVSATGAPPREYYVHVKRQTNKAPTEDCLLGVEVLDDAGNLLGTMEGVLFGVLDGARDLTSRPTDIVFRESWVSLPDSSQNAPSPSQIIFVGSPEDCPAALRSALKQKDIPYDFCETPNDLSPLPGMAVVVLGSNLEPGEAVEDGSERNAWTLIETAQKLATDKYKNVRLFCFTHGVHSCGSEGSLAQSTLWGIARIIAGERPNLWGGLYDIQSNVVNLTSGERLLSALGTAPNEDVIMVSDDDFLALRLTPALSADAERTGGLSSRHDGCRSNATYLITGGLGALGLEAARYLASRG
ncbi:acyltransferase domain-containing protein, partial [Mesorhizobium sp.]|uniref:acyltransferase domain-containing protein n=1 Tax=Mesorhizobium sp. TaxID=1871066 RepID=UPI00257A5EC3